MVFHTCNTLLNTLNLRYYGSNGLVVPHGISYDEFSGFSVALHKCLDTLDTYFTLE